MSYKIELIGTCRGGNIYLKGGTVDGLNEIIAKGSFTILVFYANNYIEGKIVNTKISDLKVLVRNVQSTGFVKEITDEIKYILVIPGESLY